MPENHKLEFINLQTNTICPLKCSHCYQRGSKDMVIDPDWAAARLHEGARLGVKYVNILGGEPLLFSHIDWLLRVSADYGLITHMATSGVNLERANIIRLFSGGLNRLFVSLDGSSEKINSISRNGYNYAVRALKLGGKLFPDKVVAIWVCNSRNIYDFDDYLGLLENLGIYQLCILKLKNFAHFDQSFLPSGGQIKYLKQAMERHANNFIFYPDTCWKELVNLLQEHVVFGKDMPCDAGRSKCAINADHTYSPCTHFSIREHFASLEEYWNLSPILAGIRSNFSFYGCNLL